jgi:aspartyl-tRNA(Asn)/glutamyl-tRNA(Gln) amidotransferase subunit A
LKNYLSLEEIREDIDNGTLSVEALVKNYLQNIRDSNNEINAFLEVYEKEALEKAKEIDSNWKVGKQGKLAGMVVGIKDVLCYDKHPITCSSNILAGFESQFTATAVQRLINEDAIIIGRQNCDEFAMGSSNEHSAYGVVRNPVDVQRVPGGSSGGSAAAVRANYCQVSLGTDTGGSVRQPAAFCGVIGLKPTYSRISRFGLAAYASSFDSIGIISKSISDNALILEVIAGSDENDSTVSQQDVPEYSALLQETGSLKIGYIEETLYDPGLSNDIKQSTLEAIEKMKSMGHKVEPVHFELLDYVLPTYYILTTAEASSNLSRYDGIRYGFRSTTHENLENLYKYTRAEGFGHEVKKRIMLGTFVLSASYYDAYYTKAQKVRRLIRESTKKMLEGYEFIISPTTPNIAFHHGDHDKNQLEMYLEDLFTVQASVAGMPAISLPNGNNSEGMPVGLHIMTREFNEARLFAFSKNFLDYRA